MSRRLSDVIDAATGGTVAVADLLRMTKVLAARMNTPPLLDWVDHELAGYPRDAALPEYRGPFPVGVTSEWSGPFSSVLHNVPIPPSAVPQELRDAGAFVIEWRESVSEVQRLSQVDEPLHFPWPTDVVGRLNQQMRRGDLKALQGIAPMHGIVRARRLVSPATASAVLDNVRTRVLSLALDLEKVMPDAGEPGATLTDPAAVASVINVIYGHGNTLAIDSPGAVQMPAIAAGDLAGLLDALAQLGCDPEDLDELGQAIRADDAEEPEAEEQRGPGPRVKTFMGKAALGGLKTAGQAGLQEGAKLLGECVRAYYGI